MADFSKSIKLVVDVVTGNASSGLKSLKSEIDNTEGAWGKMKVAGSGAFDFIKQNAAVFAVSAGTAITAFGVKVVNDFQKAALGAGELSDALGITTEDASRLQEIAGDLGIGVDAAESAIGKMNKTAAATPEKFAAIGAELVRNKDGSLDVIKTFEGVATALDAIPDPAARAKAASDIFGKGWMSIAELIAQGGQGIRDSLASVEKQKVFSPEQTSQARKFRDDLDEIKGVAESAALVIGGKLVESLDSIIGAAIEVGTVVHDLGEKIQDMIPAEAQRAGFSWGALLSTFPDIARQAAFNFKVLKDTITGTGDESKKATDDVTKLFAGFQAGDQYLQSVREHTKELAAEQVAANEAAQKYTDTLSGTDWGASTLNAAVKANQGYTDSLFGLSDIAADSEKAIDDFGDSIKNADGNVDASTLTFDLNTEAGRKQQAALKGIASTLDTQFAAAFADAHGNLDTFRGKANEISDNTLKRLQTEFGLSDQQVDELRTSLGLTATDWEARFKLSGTEEARQKIGLLQTAINDLPKDVQTRVNQEIIKGDYVGALNTIQNYYNSHPLTVPVKYQVVPGNQIVAAPHAAGGTVGINEPVSLVGEQGPELVSLPAGSRVYPAAKTKEMLSGGDASTTYEIHVHAEGTGVAAVMEAQRRALWLAGAKPTTAGIR